jgi:hypothetical protein
VEVIMALVDVTCPSCNSSIQIPDNQSKVYCLICGKPFAVQESYSTVIIGVTQKFTSTSEVDDSKPLDEGELALQIRDYRLAYQCFCEAIDRTPRKYEAWEGCLRAVTKKYSLFDFNVASCTGLKGIPAIIINTLKYAPEHERTRLVKDIKKLIYDLKRDVYNRWKEVDMLTIQKPGKARIVIGAIVLTLSPLALLGGITAGINSGNFWYLFIDILILVASIFMLISGSKKRSRTEMEYRVDVKYTYSRQITDTTLREYSDKLNEITLD